MSLNNSGGFRSRSARGRSEKKSEKNTERRSGKKRSDASQQTTNRGAAGGRREPQPQGAPPESLGVDTPREIAYRVLERVRTTRAYANLMLPGMLRDARLSGRDAAFATELTYGTLRTSGLLDAIISSAASRPVAQIDPEVLDALRLGAYQVLFTRVEDHAAVDTTVKLTGGLRQFQATGFVNAVMRTITRTTPEAWIDQLTPADPIEAAAFRTAHPHWIARSFAQVLPSEELEAALEADSTRPRVHLVARPGEISAEELALVTGGEEGKYSPYAVYLESGDPGDLEPVKQGLAAVQDEGSQLIARAVVEAPIEGEDTGRWLDLCAGPGGKAVLMGALARVDSARLDAVEVSPHRAKLIERMVRNLPVTVHVADGRDSGLEPGFDRVLVDAPCSGLGALRRRPEARWRKQDSEIEALNTLQYELLSSAVDLVRPGGVIVYSTCSPDLRETRQVIEKALADLPVEELPAGDLLPGMEDTGEDLSAQMWPHRHGTDAMFLSVLRRL